MSAPSLVIGGEAARTRVQRASPADAWDDRRGQIFVAFVVLAWMLTPIAGFRAVLILLTVAGFAAAVAGLWRPAIGLHGIAILCVLDAGARVFIFTGGLLRYNTFNYWLVIALFLFTPAVLRMQSVHFRLHLVLVVLLLCELLMSDGLADGLEHALNASAGLAVTIYFVRGARRPGVWYWIGVQSAVLAALGGLAFQVYKTSLPPINPNAWSAFGVTALFAICLAFPSAAGRPRGQPLLLGLAAADLLWVFLSGSRGNTLIALCCAVYLLVATRGVGRRVIGLGMAFLVAMAIWTTFPVVRENAFARVEKLTDEQRSLSNRTSGRSDLVRGAWIVFLQHPFGVGTGGFPTAWRELSAQDPTIEYGRGIERAAHSAWMKLLAENGVPGFLMLAAYVLSFAVAGMRRRVIHLRRLGLLVTVALATAFLTTEFQSKGLWFLAGGATVLLYAPLQMAERARTIRSGRAR